jgi:hypothetical protein
MTTPRQYTEPTDPNTDTADQQRYTAPEFSSGQVDPSSGRQVDPTADQLTDPSAGRQTDPAPQHGTGSPTSTQTAGTDAPVGDSLFGEQDLSELRSRWNDVQAAFVDDPRACVQKADSLVSSAVEQLTASFSQTRSRLEDQWSRGEEASTEDLRIALKHYRDFFDRILAV